MSSADRQKQVRRDTPLGSLDRVSTKDHFGIDHLHTGPKAPLHRRIRGGVFFTRPQLNLSAGNLRNDRRFYALLNSEPKSIQRYIRTMLDPRLAGNVSDNGPMGDTLSSPLADNRLAFIPILTNNCLTVSGWPDMVFPTFKSKEGLYKESFIQVDGTADTNQVVELNATFRNTTGQPVLKLLLYWGLYSTLVFDGTMVPYPDFIVGNALDYNTRIWRLLFDETNREIVDLAASNPALIEAAGVGSEFDLNVSDNSPMQQKEYAFRFVAPGVRYLDPILVREFNWTVERFNPDMRLENREQWMWKVPHGLLHYFLNRGYPYIDDATLKYDIWVYKDYYNARLAELEQDRVNIDDYLPAT